ncbi:MAG: two-component regulator propeller domain-containing protein [Bacteroidota bacterium]
MKRLPLLMILLAFLALEPQGQPVDFAHLNVEDGLSQNSVLAVAQDNDGFIWLGTRTGLNRYDGTRFVKYYIDPENRGTVSSNYIRALLCDSQGNLWVGTATGLFLYDAQNNNFYKIEVPAGKTDIINRLQISCFCETGKGQILVGTSLGVASIRYDTGSSASSRVGSFRYDVFSPALNSTIGLNILSMLQSRDGSIWIGSEKGAHQIRVPAGQSISSLTRPERPAFLKDSTVTTLAEDDHHQIWIGTLAVGVRIFHPNTGTLSYFQMPQSEGFHSAIIRKILFTAQKSTWIGTREGIVIVDSNASNTVIVQNIADDNTSLSQNSIQSMFQDRNGTIWAGTYFGGVNLSHQLHNSFINFKKSGYYSSLSDNVISSVVEDRNQDLWIATEGGGLNRYHRPTKTFTAFKNDAGDPSSIGSNLVKILYIDQNQNLWAGTHAGGFAVYLPATQSFKRYYDQPKEILSSGSEIMALMEDPDGMFWAGSQKGVKLFKKENTALTEITQHWILDKLGNHYIRTFLKDSRNNCWIATTVGLFLLRPNSHELVPFSTTAPHHLPVNDVNIIAEGTNGDIWLGTNGGGLCRYQPSNGQLTIFSVRDGLPGNNVVGILCENDNQVWVSTDNGLSRLHVKEKRFINYTKHDGLPGNTFNVNACLKTSRGEFFFGGYSGLTSFYPSAITVNSTPPKLFITGLKLFNKEVSIGDETGLLERNIIYTKKITLSASQNVFSVEFAALNFIRSGKNQFAYKIEGVDKNWNYTQQPNATYNNLPAGHYLFLAKGSNNDGEWSSPVELQLVILPPWYRTWWAYTIYALLAAGIVFFIIRFFFLQALLRRDQELTSLKLNFFTNISHEIRTYLSLITGPVERLLMEKKEDDPDTLQLVTIKNNSADLLQLVTELMDFRKAETGNLNLQASRFNIVPFAQAVYQSFHELFIQKSIVTDFSASSGTIELYFDKEQMKKVLFNLFSNAFKFTPEGGRVSLIIEETTDEVAIKVTDNGKGISPENIARLFDNYFQENDYGQQNTGYGIGLALSKSIVELHHGTLTAESQQGTEHQAGSTCFTVTLKKGCAHFAKIEIQDGPVVTSPGEQPEYRMPENVVGTLPAPILNADGQQFSILVVEDNPQVRKFITDALQEAYNVLEAGNGLAGYNMATEQIPDLIISDVMMPEMDGYTLCGKVKTDERTSHIPFILLTAKSSVSNQVSGLEMGADIYLTKPFSIQILTLQIKNLLASSARIRQRYSQQISGIEPLPAQESIAGSGLARPAENSVHTLDNEFIKRLIALAEENTANPVFDLEMICRKMAMSQSVLYKKVKALTGLTVNEIVKSVRLKKAATLLAENKYTVYEIADMVGYDDTKYFSKEFKKQFGVNPSKYGQDGDAEG